MARTEKTLALIKNLGTSLTAAYTLPAAVKTVITNITVCNVTTGVKNVSIVLTRAGVDYYLHKTRQISGNMSFDFTGHIVLDTENDALKLQADASNSFDVVVSGWERTA